MKKVYYIVLFLLFGSLAHGQSLAEAVANTAMKLWKDSFALEGDKVAKWRYDQGVILKGIEGIWNRTGEGKWFNYIQKSIDFYVSEDGTIKGYKPDEYNIDHINNGKLLLLLYQVTGKEKYYKAATLLRDQLKTHPRTSEGGFWHKKIYPYQMWLDGLYMGQPFYAEYAKLFHEDTAFNDIARQFTLVESHTRDPKSGLLYHGWDESKKQKWADKNTGLSPNVWGRALGWYGMAMVDALDYFPVDHPGRDSIIRILNRFAKAIASIQDDKTGLWYDVPNMPKEPKNYFEASSSSMLVYTLSKAVRKGYLPATYLEKAKKGFDGMVRRFIKVEDGQTNLYGTVAVSGLGGNPYRDGSFDYYMSEPVVMNDPKGIGAFINAANEIELLGSLSKGKGKSIVLDTYYNNEWKKDITGTNIRYHYTWDDKSNTGFSMLGNVFNNFGVQTETLEVAPTFQKLSGKDIYLIVDIDTDKETAKTNKITGQDAKTITAWVKRGGKLVLMGNDTGNADLKSLNVLASKFGITFNEDNYNQVKNNQFEQGSVLVTNGKPVFCKAKNLFIKELSTINVSNPATPMVSKEGKVIMAIAKFGKGFVFAVGDPWLYNEYVDGRKLPTDYQNYEATKELVQWLIGKPNKQ